MLTESIAATDKANWARTFPRSVLAMVLARQGDVEQAREMLEEAKSINSERPQDWPENILSWAKAVVLGVEKRWLESFEAFQESAAMSAEKRMRPNQARVVRDWAEAHVARGEPGDAARAVELLNEAIAIYEEMGSPAYVERIQARLDEIDG